MAVKVSPLLLSLMVEESHQQPRKKTWPTSLEGGAYRLVGGGGGVDCCNAVERESRDRVGAHTRDSNKTTLAMAVIT